MKIDRFICVTMAMLLTLVAALAITVLMEPPPVPVDPSNLTEAQRQEAVRMALSVPEVKAHIGNDSYYVQKPDAVTGLNGTFTGVHISIGDMSKPGFDDFVIIDMD